MAHNKGGDSQIKPVPVEPYLDTPSGYDLNPVMLSTKAHAYVVRGAQLMVAPSPLNRIELPGVNPTINQNVLSLSDIPVWPLAGYYAYLDTKDITSKVDFDSLGLLWTDETENCMSPTARAARRSGFRILFLPGSTDRSETETDLRRADLRPRPGAAKETEKASRTVSQAWRPDG